MKILRAEHLGMCFGVRDAINLAVKHAAAEPLTVLGALVHNESVIGGLRERGIQFEDHAENVMTQNVMITAHGTSERMMNRVRALKLNVLEATCPLVRMAHRVVNHLVAAGFHPVIIGKREHVEVRGMTDDLAEFDVILADADVAALKERPKFGVAAQTTQPIERVERLVELIRERFPNAEVRFVDTVCRPTKENQQAAMDLAGRCEVMVVIGGAHSNNTLELVNSCRRQCQHVHHAQGPDDLRAEWFTGADSVGITAGTSTPDDLIDQVEERLRELETERLANANPTVQSAHAH